MAATIYVAENRQSRTVANPNELTVWLDDTGPYWFLYRYFESANLDQSSLLVDLYGGAEIAGYQLDRLEDEMKAAREDIAFKPAQWKVLTGWRGSPARNNEIWSVVEKCAVAKIIDQILTLATIAREHQLKLIVVGD